MPLLPRLQERLLADLRLLYADRAEECLGRIAALAERRAAGLRARRKRHWDERDVVLIAYADHVRSAPRAPLAALGQFLRDAGLDKLVSILHVLPFFPSSSDDGFAVVDYRHVDPEFGTWQDLDRLAGSFDLMVDLVLNHCSAGHGWFRAFLAGEAPYARWFIEGDPAEDLAQVARPRSTPLLTRFAGASGSHWVWTTFSADQVDLNWANPDVLLEMLDTLLFYLEHGARVIRLDAIAYLWKRPGTTCLHLPETHAAVRVLRAVLETAAPGAVLLTETNVPHRENVSYFGAGDEAQAVYQFSLPPLVIEAFQTGDAGALKRWLSALEPPPPGTTYLNFTASHDGVGVRPLEGLLPRERLAQLATRTRALGGAVSMRRLPDGTDSPYELNISYFSALTTADRFLASQAVMLALRGIPAIYFPSLVAGTNDLEGVRHTGRARSINRHKFARAELDAMLADPDSTSRRVFDGYRALLAARIGQPAFHPDAPQETLDVGADNVLAWLRTSLDGRQQVLVLVNVADREATVRVPAPFARPGVKELVARVARWESDQRLRLGEAGVVWLEKASS